MTGLSLPYKVRYWWHKKQLRKAGYFQVGDIVFRDDSYWYIERLSCEYPIIRVCLKNLQNNQKYRNWHDWEQPLFKVVGFANSELSANMIIQKLKNSKRRKRNVSNK